MGLFSLGSEMSMIPLGEAVGKEITRSKKVWVIVAISFLIGVIITVAEPDLQVLASQVPAIENNVIIWSVALGVGVFLVIALLRILLGIPLSYLLNPAHHERHAMLWQGVDREWFAMPYQDGEQQRYIWGATAGMLRNLYRFLAA